MIDLTGANLVAYLLRIIRNVANRNPRFRKALGEVTFANALTRTPVNLIQFGDVQVIIKSVSTQGNRLSPDYYMETQIGRAVLAKVADKDGLFVEFVTQSMDDSLLSPGVYYMHVNAVNEETREVSLTIQKYSWKQGHTSNAQGSLIYFRKGLDQTIMVPTDGAAPAATVNYTHYPAYMALLTPVETLVITNSVTTQVLTPNVDYWVIRQNSKVICQLTAGGQEIISVPTNATQLTFVDETGYTLRQNIDFTYYGGPAFIQLSPLTPKGSTITAVGLYETDPSGPYASVNPENILPVTIPPNDTLTPEQVFVMTSAGNFNSVVQTSAGLIYPTLLLPGQWARWELRITEEQFEAKALKMNMNKNLVPGLWVAIGDVVEQDDQCAIIVSPNNTEIYEVYGSKENISFTLEVKANDLMTASELSEMIKAELLIRGRNNMEADGITIYECSRDQRGEQRDPSGTAATYSYEIRVTAAADWKVFIPLVTRMVSFEVDQTEFTASRAVPVARMQALGRFAFVPWQA